MLVVDRIHTFYGASHILHGVSLNLAEGAVVALLGRNGAGKTTTLRSIIGLTPPRRGAIRFNGADTAGKKPHLMARLGVSYLPETRGILPSLSVLENLTLAEGRRPGPWTLDRGDLGIDVHVRDASLMDLGVPVNLGLLPIVVEFDAEPRGRAALEEAHFPGTGREIFKAEGALRVGQGGLRVTISPAKPRMRIRIRR